MPSVSQIWERIYPVLIGMIAGGLVLYFWPGGFLFAKSKHWELNKLFAAGFNFSAVATPFLFTFYTFVLTAERGFIARMRHSIYFAMLIEYTMSALKLGTVLAIASVVLDIVGPHPKERWDLATFLWSGWAFIAAWSVAAFIRTAIIFIAFASADG